MADKSKRPASFDLKSADRKSRPARSRSAVTAFVIVFAVALVVYIVTSHHDKKRGVAGQGDTVRVTSSKLVTKAGSSNPKAVIIALRGFPVPGLR